MFNQLAVILLFFDIILSAPGCDICNNTGGVDVAVGNYLVACGNEIHVPRPYKQPEVEMPSAKQDKTYTLVMSDPDAPVPAYLHWLRVGIPGSSLKNGRGNIGGEDVSGYSYRPPSPPKDVHRYEFRIYEETQSEPPSYSGNSRSAFNVKNFETNNKLKSPVGTFCFKVAAKM